jgi:hypothetical protein
MVNDMGFDPKKSPMTWEGCDLWSAAMKNPRDSIILKLLETLPMTEEWWNGKPGAGFLKTLSYEMVYKRDNFSEEDAIARFQLLKKYGISLRQRSSELRCVCCPLYATVSAKYERCFQMLVEDFGFDVSKAVYDNGSFTLWNQLRCFSSAYPAHILQHLNEHTDRTERDDYYLQGFFNEQINGYGNEKIVDFFRELNFPMPDQKMICLYIEKNLGLSKPAVVDKLLELVDWEKSKGWVLKGLKKAVLESEHKFIDVLASKVDLQTLPPEEIRALWNTAFASGTVDTVKHLIALKLPPQFGDHDSILSIATEWQNPEFLKLVIETIELEFTKEELDRSFAVAFEEGKLDIVRLLAPQSNHVIPMLLCHNRSATKEPLQVQMAEDRSAFADKFIIPALISNSISEAKDIFAFLESLNNTGQFDDTIKKLKTGYEATHAIAQYPARVHRKHTNGMYSSNNHFADRQWKYAKTIAQTYRYPMTHEMSAIQFLHSAASARYQAAQSTGDKYSEKYIKNQTNGLITPWSFLSVDNKTVRFPHYGNCLPFKNEVLARLQSKKSVPGVKKGYHEGEYTLTYSFEGKEYELTEVQSNTEAGETDFGIFPSSSRHWSTVWNHPSRDTVSQLWSHFSNLDGELRSMSKEEVSKDPQKFRKLALRTYWLGCNMPLTMRGHAQNTWMLFLKRFKEKGLPLPRISQKIGTSDTAAITLPLHIFIERADELIEGLPS